MLFASVRFFSETIESMCLILELNNRVQLLKYILSKSCKCKRINAKNVWEWNDWKNLMRFHAVWKLQSHIAYTRSLSLNWNTEIHEYNNNKKWQHRVHMSFSIVKCSTWQFVAKLFEEYIGSASKILRIYNKKRFNTNTNLTK